MADGLYCAGVCRLPMELLPMRRLYGGSASPTASAAAGHHGDRQHAETQNCCNVQCTLQSFSILVASVLLQGGIAMKEVDRPLRCDHGRLRLVIVRFVQKNMGYLVRNRGSLQVNTIAIEGGQHGKQTVRMWHPFFLSGMSTNQEPPSDLEPEALRVDEDTLGGSALVGY